MISEKHIDILAKAAFAARERVRALGMMNSPEKYEDREKAFVELVKAQRIAVEAQRLLDVRIQEK